MLQRCRSEPRGYLVENNNTNSRISSMCDVATIAQLAAQQIRALTKAPSIAT